MRSIITRILLGMLFLLGFCIAGIAQTATIVTDKPDYAPRSTAIFTGDGFAPNEQVLLKVKNISHACNTIAPDSSYLPWTVTADASGHFVTNWTVCDCAGDSLRLKATGQISALVAIAYFSDGELRITNATQSPFSPNNSAGINDVNIITLANVGSGTENQARVRIRQGAINGTLVFETSNQSITGNGSVNINWNGKGSVGAFNGVFVPDGTYYVIAYTNQSGGSETTGAGKFQIVVVDNTSPVISGFANITTSNDPGACSASVSWSTPTVSDANAVSIVKTQGPNSGSLFAVGTVTTIIYTATDAAGNTSSDSFTVSVNDTQKPTITAPANISVNTDNNACTASGVALGSPTFSDNCTGATVSNNAPSVFPKGTTSVTWMVTDASGNTATAIQTVTVSDIQNPTITAPASVTVSADNNQCTATGVVLGSPMFSDNCVGAAVSNNAPSTYPVGSTTVTWTVTDAAGNTATATQTVTVTDNQKPSITAPAMITIVITPGQCSGTTTLGNATTSDNCGVAAVSNDHSSSTFPVGSTTVTWSVTDIHGNTNTATQTVIVIDNEKPLVVSVTNPAVNNAAGQCAATLSAPAPNVSDNCGIASNVSDHPSNVYPVGTTTVTWTITDVNGNTQTATQTVTVTDNEKPGITAGANVFVNNDAGNCTAIVTLSQPTTTDNCTVATVTSNHPSTTYPVGTTTVTWTVTDVNGNTNTTTQTVTVTDNEKPSITAPAMITIINTAGQCSGTTALGNANTSDNCGVATVSNDHASSTFPVGTTIVNWTVTDIHGNTNTATQTVVVVDNEKPAVVSVSNPTANSAASLCSATVSAPAPNVTDNCGIASNVSNHPSNIYPVGVTTVTWTITDVNGNTQTATQTVTVTDNEKPTITAAANVSVNNTTGSCSATVTLAQPTTGDNCAVASVVNNHPSSTYPVGSTTVTWTVTDVNGNTNTATQIVTVTDTEKPSITAPANITINNTTNQCSGSTALGTPTVSDNCVILSFSNDHASTVYPVGTTIVSWSVTDVNGNTNTATQTVTVIDAQAPSFTCPANINVSACTNNPTWATPSATDNCPGVTVTQIAGPASGSSFAPGSTTTITYKATDAAGNSSTCSFTVTKAPDIVLSTTQTNVSCFGGNNGSINLTVSGGTTAQTGGTVTYTQDFNTLANSGTSSTMPAGWFFVESGTGANTTYTASAGTDNTGNTYSYGTGSSTDRALGTLLSGSVTSTIGAGSTFINNTGSTVTSLTIQYTGEQWRLGATGRADKLDFQYSTNATAINNGTWNDVDALDFSSPVTSGTAGALDGNAAGNRSIKSSIITGLSIPNGATFWIRWTDMDVSGSDDGLGIDDFSMTMNSLSAGYTYTWTGTGVNPISEDQSGLGAGTYSVTVKDANNCSVTTSVTITQPNQITNTHTESNFNGYNISCNGGSNGAINLTVTGGTTPYSYAWTGTGVNATAEDQSGLKAGTYNVTVTDANGCTTNATITLTQPALLSSTNTKSNFNGFNISCFGGNNGSINLIPTGGVTPYTYAWTGTGVNAAAEDQSGLTAGAYNVTITDANGCTTSASITLTQPTVLANTHAESNFNGFNISCNGGNNGSIDLTVSGGVSSYTYVWTGTGVAAGTQDQNGLSAGTYGVTITDANGCTSVASITLTQPTAIALSAIVTNVNCFGQSNGAINLSVSGGVPSNPGGVVTYTQDFNSLAASGTSSSMPTGWFFSESGSNANTAYTAGTGSTATGDTWSFGAAASSDRALGTLLSGSLNSTIGAGSTFVNNTGSTVTNLTIQYTGEQWRLGATGRADRLDFQYSTNATSITNGTWVDVDALDFSSPVITGTVGALDGNAAANRTVKTSTITGLSIPNGATFWVRWSDFNATDADDGLGIDDFSMTMSSAASPYNYTWTGAGVNPTAEDQSGLAAGTYTVTVKDANNCTASATYTVSQPIQVTVNATKTDATCLQNTDGTITVTASAGAAITVNGNPYNPSATYGVGTYTIVATAPNGNNSGFCTASTSVTIGVDDHIAPIVITKNITVQLNASGTAGITAAQVDNGSSDACGIAIMSVNPNSFTCANVGPNTVTLTVTDVNGNSSSGTAIVTVQDNIAPAIICPASATISCDASSLPANTGAATATDNCTVASVSYTDFSGQDANVNVPAHYNYTITRAWKAIDVNGNSSTCVQTITVQDVTAPSITCPANKLLNCQDATTVAANGSATATDNCSPIAITSSDVSTQDANVNAVGHYNYVITRTWKATDVSGNSSTCVQTITVQDVTAPSITCPANKLLNCQDVTTVAANGSATATDNCSPVGITSSDVSTQDADVNAAAHYNYTITRTWKATDVSGNSSTCVQTITVQDVTAPWITCPANKLLNCQDVTTVAANGSATATDNCSPVGITSSDVSTQDADVNAAAHYNYTITRTWKATDVSGNSSTCVQTITVQDITAPSITCPANKLLNCQDATTVTSNGSATATDNCSPVAITSSDVSTQDADVNAAAHYNYTITRTWKATDVSSNSSTCVQTITVQDVTAPNAICQNTTIYLDANGSAIIPAATNNLPFYSYSCDLTTTSFTNVSQSFTATASGYITRVGAGIGLYSSSVSYGTVITSTSHSVNYGVMAYTPRNVIPYSTCAAGNNMAYVNLPAPFYVNAGETVTISFSGTSGEKHYQGGQLRMIVIGNTGLAIDGGSNDACGPVTVTASNVEFSCANLGTNNVTLTVTDVSGNSATCTAVVTVVDNIAPVITCPANATIHCDASNLPANTGTATATDNCGGGSLQITYSDVSHQNANSALLTHYNYTIDRTWKAADASGNSSTCVQIITVQDVTAPSITCPANVTVNCSDDKSPSSTGFASASDNCAPGANTLITFTQTTNFSGDASNLLHYNYTITRTWKATDVAGNSSTCVQTITVQDVTAPSITCPANTTVSCQDDNSSTATGVATATDNCAPGANIAITQSQTSTQSADPASVLHYNYTITRTWKATDVAGNSSTCVQTITVQDITAPSISCPANTTVSCQNDNTSTATGVATATDNCAPVANIAITQSQTSTQSADPASVLHYNYVITRTWKAIDVNGNSSTCVQTITVQDITAPSITCPANKLLNCQDATTVTSNGSATATDNCSPVEITSSDVSTQDADVNAAAHYNYTITRTWKATDVSGNSSTCVQTITVQDVTAPSIACPANKLLNCQDVTTVAANGSATATDNCSPVAITSSDVSTQDADVNAAAHYNYTITRTWKATDVSGNSSTCVQTITVQDVTAPSITCPANKLLNCQDATTVAANGSATATDNCSPIAITSSDVSTQDANVNAVGHYNYVITRTWKATDVSGNSSTCVQTITVQDVTAPSITCPANKLLNCQDVTTVAANGSATATDNCSPVGITSSDVSTQDADVNAAAHYNYTITRTWKATDVSGNSSTCVQTITVQDVTAPWITCPANKLLNCQDVTTVAANGSATATDNCSPVAITSSDVSTQDADVNAAAHYNYTITRTWKATDVSGNSSTCVQTITVQDVTAPSITCPANKLLNCQDATTVAANGSATATDNCSPIAITSSDVSTQDANVNAVGHYNYVITRTWKATDVSGNSSTCVQMITVQDVTAPSITCPANKLLNCQDVTTVAANGSATATDNCSPVGITSSDVSTQDADVNAAAHYNYTITRTWKATDVSGNSSTCVQTITIQDVTAPSITCPANKLLNCQDVTTVAANGSATATDNCSPVGITSSDVSTQDADVNAAAHYNYTITRTWKATDVSGNSSTCVQTITVQDVTAPSITCPANKLLNCQDATTVAANGSATATDNCSPIAITSSDVSTQDANVNAVGHYNYVITRTWKATDVSGNSSTCIQTITVQDVTAPSISCPANKLLNCQDATTVAANGSATATDNCSPVVITSSDVSTQDANVNAVGHYNYVITRTWKATDVSGNSSTCIQTITVQDVTAPSISCPANKLLNCQDATTVAANGSATATDNCSPFAITSSDVSTQDANINAAGHYNYVITRTWKAIDVSGNSSTCVQTITVRDITAPVISTCPPSVTVNPNNIGCTALLLDYRNSVVKSDNCSPVTLTQSPAPGTPLALGANVITITATDASGNSSTCTFTVTNVKTLLASCSTNNPILYYGYSGDQSTTITAQATGGVAPYTVKFTMSRPLNCNVVTSAGDESWTPGTGTIINQNLNITCPGSGNAAGMPTSSGTVSISGGSYSVNLSLLADATITATITDANGCVSSCSTFIHATDVRCFAGNSGNAKVTICHQTGSSKNPCVKICVDESAVAEHLAHGDYVGECTANCVAPPQVATTPSVKNSQPIAEVLEASVMPNPTPNFFNVVIKGKNDLPVSVTVRDVYGRKLHYNENVGKNATLQLGHTWIGGTYFVEVIQGKERVILKVIKAN